MPHILVKWRPRVTKWKRRSTRLYYKIKLGSGEILPNFLKNSPVNNLQKYLKYMAHQEDRLVISSFLRVLVFFYVRVMNVDLNHFLGTMAVLYTLFYRSILSPQIKLNQFYWWFMGSWSFITFCCDTCMHNIFYYVWTLSFTCVFIHFSWYFSSSNNLRMQFFHRFSFAFVSGIILPSLPCSLLLLIIILIPTS